MPTIIVYWSGGRTDQQKSKVAQQITQTMIENAGAKREDVLIIFQNIENGDAARGGQILKAPVLKSPE